MIYDIRQQANTIVPQMLEQRMGLPSGIEALDKQILGFCPGELIIIAGRPGMGKSSLARTIALSIGQTSAIVIYNFEESSEVCAQALLTNLAKVNHYAIKRDGITESIQTQLDRTSRSLSTYRILINSDSSVTPAHIRKGLNELFKEEPISAIIIDYLQLVSLGSFRKRQEEVTEISRQLNAIAKDFNIPVIALSQLNRDCTARETSKPHLEDLRESGSLEQDAVKVLLLHRPSYYDMKFNPEAIDTGEAEIIIAKNRWGPTGSVKCVWVSDWCRFMDVPGTVEDF